MKEKSIKIVNQEIRLKEFRGQRVVTFKDIDTVHKRVEGTASRNFRENKERFIEGIDYFEISRNDVGTNFVGTYEFDKKAPKGIILTETGYLMLAKTLKDDLAWEVQRQLVNTYFNYKKLVKRLKPIDKALKQHMNIAKTIIETTGVKDGIAYAVAIDEAEKDTGYSYDAYKKLLPSATHEIGTMNASMLAKKMNMKAQEVNKLLQKFGYQEKRDNNWRLTEKGKEFAEEMPYTNHGHSGYQIKWNENILKEIKNMDD